MPSSIHPRADFAVELARCYWSMAAYTLRFDRFTEECCGIGRDLNLIGYCPIRRRVFLCVLGQGSGCVEFCLWGFLLIWGVNLCGLPPCQQ